MGIMRKTMSVSTAGLVSYRNKDERAAKVAKQTRNATRAQVVQNAAMLEEQRKANANHEHANAQRQAQWLDTKATQDAAVAAAAVTPTPSPVTAGPPAGWYMDPDGSGMMRWYDGSQWTDFKQPRSDA